MIAAYLSHAQHGLTFSFHDSRSLQAEATEPMLWMEAIYTFQNNFGCFYVAPVTTFASEGPWTVVRHKIGRVCVTQVQYMYSGQ